MCRSIPGQQILSRCYNSSLLLRRRVSVSVSEWSSMCVCLHSYNKINVSVILRRCVCMCQWGVCVRKWKGWVSSCVLFLLKAQSEQSEAADLPVETDALSSGVYPPPPLCSVLSAPHPTPHGGWVTNITDDLDAARCLSFTWLGSDCHRGKNKLQG